MVCLVKKLNKDAKLPNFARKGDAGADIFSVETKQIYSGDTVVIKTGIAVSIPKGYELQVRPKSGLALKNGLTVLNSPGTIDSGYRGEVCVLLQNTHPDKTYKVDCGQKIAQLVFSRVPDCEYMEVDDLDETERNEGGFGSTGDGLSR